MSLIPNGQEVESLLRKNAKAFSKLLITPSRIDGSGALSACAMDQATHISISLGHENVAPLHITHLPDTSGLGRLLGFIKALNPEIELVHHTAGNRSIASEALPNS